jgi:hypothetical protein
MFQGQRLYISKKMLKNFGISKYGEVKPISE